MLNLDLRPLDRPGVQHADHRCRRQRAGLQCADEPFRLRRGSRTAGGRRPRPDAVVHFAAIAALHDPARQRDLPRQRDEHLQRDRGGDEARHPQDRDRVERDDLRRLLRGGRQGLPPASRWKRTTTSTRWTATGSRRWSTRDGARLRAARPAPTSTRCRIGNIIEPHEYDRFPGFLADPLSRKRNAWSYIDARDLGQIVHLCLEKDGLGFQVFNAVNDTITADEPTAEFLKRWSPGTPITAPARRVRGAALEPQDPRGAGLPRGARLAEVREALARQRPSRERAVGESRSVSGGRLKRLDRARDVSAEREERASSARCRS